MLIQLAITGMLVALLPLAIVLSSKDVNKYRKLVWITLFLTFDLIMFGSFTRLTDSGLGCPDWPGCYGQANPVQAHADIRAAEALMPTGPVTVVKAWIEMIHRYIAMAVGVLIIAIMVVAWRRWLKSSRQLINFAPGLPTSLFLLVCLQGAFGAWTVTMKLQPIIVTIHLLLGLLLLAMLTILAARHSVLDAISSAARNLFNPAVLALALLVIQIVLGGWVSTNYAVMACTDFPLCHGMLVPPMDFEHGFTWWRELGKTASGDLLPVEALTAIHWVHRNFAFIVIAYIAWIAHKAYKIEGLRKTGKWILIVLALQFASGVSTIFLSWPIVIAIMHNGGAALLVLLLVMLIYKSRRSAVKQTA
ncbi:MAG TPA: COX15/CtaA family protein [Gallionellaceae bacterium]|nr:COX15/CtaA family protein [Gallionellaceae bacterium]